MLNGVDPTRDTDCQANANCLLNRSRERAMKLPRRHFLHLAASTAALPAVSPLAWAEAYPVRPVRLIVGFASGGPADILAPLIGQRLPEHLGPPFALVNRVAPGA